MSSVGKAIKTIAFTATAQEHHIAVKTKSVLKWLKSGHEVRVSIQGKADRHKAMEKIFDQIERETKAGSEVKQKLIKPELIKFNLRPLPGAANLVVDESTSQARGDQLVDDISSGKDILSDEFEKELNKSIQEDISRRKK